MSSKFLLKPNNKITINFVFFSKKNVKYLKNSELNPLIGIVFYKYFLKTKI